MGSSDFPPDEVRERAVDVQAALAGRGQHRVRVLHYDRDFDLTAEVTRQPVE